MIGIAAIVSIISIGEGLRETITGELESFGANNILISPGGGGGGFGPPSFSEPLNEKDVKNIERIRGTDTVFGILMRGLSFEFKDEKKVLNIFGLDFDNAAEFFSDMGGYELQSGRIPRPEEKDSIVMGYLAAKKSFDEEIRVKDKVTINDENFRVAGIFKETGSESDDNLILMCMECMRDLTGVEDEISIIFVKVSDAKRIDSIAEDIQEEMDDEHGEDVMSVFTTKQLTEQILMITGSLTLFLSAIAGVSLLVAGIGISNTMLMSVMERTREIGIMKSIGASNIKIMMLFLTESIIIGFIGGVVGILLGILISQGLSQVDIQGGLPLITAVTPQLLIMGLTFSVIVGAVSGFFPARRAAKLNPIEALRYE